MTMTAVEGLVKYPDWPKSLLDNNVNPSSSTVNASDEDIAYTVRVTKAGTIDKIYWRCATMVAGTNTFRIAFQNLDANGFPDGTDTHWRDYTITGSEDNTIISTGLITTDGTDGGTKKTVAIGDQFAIVWYFQSYTSGSASVSYIPNATDSLSGGMHLFRSSGTSWATADDLNGDTLVAIEMSDASILPMTHAVMYQTGTAHTLDDADTPDEYALKITVPVRMRAVGFFIKGETDTGVTAGVYSAADAQLGGSPRAVSWLEGTHWPIRYYYFTSAVTIEADTVYRIYWKPPASPTTAQIASYDLGSGNGALKAVMHNGLNMDRSVRTDGGAWTDDTERFIIAGFLIDQLDDGAAGVPPTCNYGAIPNGTRVKPAAK